MRVVDKVNQMLERCGMDHVAIVRGFNRFYTLLVGALNARFLGTDLSLPEARILFEISQSREAVAADVAASLRMDPGYVSRMLRRFEGLGLIARSQSKADGRRRPISVTSQGRRQLDEIDQRQRAAVLNMLEPLGAHERDLLGRSLSRAQALLGGGGGPVALRTFRTGDLPMIAARQSILYAEQWGWGLPMEILQGEITTAFLRDFKPGREQCWIAERDGTMAGSILVVDAGDNVAQLRLLYVEPWARGLGIGGKLVAECVRFAREAGYNRLILWTHSVLDSARRIYEVHGFRIVRTEVHDTFGKPEQGEFWELALKG